MGDGSSKDDGSTDGQSFYQFCARCDHVFDPGILDPVVRVAEGVDGPTPLAFCDES